MNTMKAEHDEIPYLSPVYNQPQTREVSVQQEQSNMSGTFRNAVFTYTGDFEAFKAHIEDLFSKGSLKYVYAQIERSEDGHLHLQGMAMGKYTQRTSYWQKHFGPNWKRIGGTNADLKKAYEYCHKEYTREQADFIDLGAFCLKGNNAAVHFQNGIQQIEYFNANRS